MTARTLIIAVCLAASSHSARAQDKVVAKDGTVRDGQIMGVDAAFFRLRLPPPSPGQAAATITIPRGDVDKIVFGPDAALDSIEKSPGLGMTATSRVRWETLEPFLGIPESHAGRAGCLYGEMLLHSGDPARHEEALTLFRRLEEDAWGEPDRQRATRGRLAAMLKLGRLEEAALEAGEIAESAGDPALLLQAKLLLAGSRIATLRQLLAHNPRWQEDPPVRAERHRLINEAADLALYPFLFHGTSRAEAAQGLWLAREVYLLAGDEKSAAEVATDLTAMYPETPEAVKAAEVSAKPPKNS